MTLPVPPQKEVDRLDEAIRLRSGLLASHISQTINVHGIQDTQYVGLYPTTAPVDFYVDPATGSDSNPGSIGAPILTLEKLSILLNNFRIRHQVRAFYNGNGNTLVGNWNFSPTLETGGTLLIQQTTFPLVTGLVGQNTGTIASRSAYTYTVSGAAWAVDELMGSLLEITSGALAGSRYAIRSNAAGTFDCGIESASLVGATFKIVKCGTDLQPANPALAAITLFGGKRNPADYILQGFSVTGGAIGIELGRDARARVQNCVARGQSVNSFISTRSGYPDMLDCFFETTSDGSTTVDVSSSKNFLLSGVVIRGPGILSTGGSTCFISRPSLGAANLGQSGHPVFIRHCDVGFKIHGNPEAFATRLIIDDIGLQAGFVNMTNILFTDCEIASNNQALYVTGTSASWPLSTSTVKFLGHCVVSGTNIGILADTETGPATIWIGGTSTVAGGNEAIYSLSPNTTVLMADTANLSSSAGYGLWFHGPHGAFVCFGGSIGPCAANGIEMEGDFCSVTFDGSHSGSFSITNCTSRGIRMVGAHGSVRTHTALSMSANGGDLQLALGAAPITIAALRAIVGPPAKLTKDANYFNLIWEG